MILSSVHVIYTEILSLKCPYIFFADKNLSLLLRCRPIKNKYGIVVIVLLDVDDIYNYLTRLYFI